MIQKPKDWESTPEITDVEKLPVGAYPIVIKAAEVKEYGSGKDAFQRLDISFDISEGEYKDYYANNYRAQQYEDKKWKGVYRLYLPKDDGSEQDVFTKRKLKTAITAIEESNSGYHWDWNEEHLKDKKAVCVFQNKEWSYNGMTGWTAQPYALISIEKFKENKFKIPNDKPLDAGKKAANDVVQNGVDILDGDEDLPF